MTRRELIQQGHDGRDITAVYFHSPASEWASVEFFDNHAPWWNRSTANDFAKVFEDVGYKVTLIRGRVDLSTGIVTDHTTGETHIDGWHLVNTCPEPLRKQINHVHTGFWSKKGEIYARHGCCWTEAARKEWHEYEETQSQQAAC